MFGMARDTSSWARHNVPILGLINPPFSRWPWNPHPVRQSKLDNLFTYLPSCRGDSSDRFVDVHIMDGWGRTACARHRFLGSCFSSCMIMTICSGQVMGQAWYVVKMYGSNMVRAVIRQNMCSTLAITYVFTQIISENISLSYRSNSWASEHCKGP